MDSSCSDRFDIVHIYKQYCEIKSATYAYREQSNTVDAELQKDNYSREALAHLLTLVESRVHASSSLFDEISKLKWKVELMGDSSEFSRFYDFVFFICRESGQKSVTVSRAITAWRLVLAGRFRLLDPWCSFVEKNHRHNISEDTWRQVLAFSRCIHENLEGYDSAGAWPVLIDDFVEHMYRIRGSNYPTAPLSCKCVNSESQQPLGGPLHGLKVLPGQKRKSSEDFMVQEPGGSLGNSSSINAKRRQCCCFSDNSMKWGDNPTGNGAVECMEILKHGSGNSISSLTGCTTKSSACAVEGCLSKKLAGDFSGRSHLQFGGRARLG